jgi:hypothetical protein
MIQTKKYSKYSQQGSSSFRFMLFVTLSAMLIGFGVMNRNRSGSYRPGAESQLLDSKPKKFRLPARHPELLRNSEQGNKA